MSFYLPLFGSPFNPPSLSIWLTLLMDSLNGSVWHMIITAWRWNNYANMPKMSYQKEEAAIFWEKTINRREEMSNVLLKSVWKVLKSPLAMKWLHCSHLTVFTNTSTLIPTESWSKIRQQIEISKPISLLLYLFIIIIIIIKE